MLNEIEFGALDTNYSLNQAINDNDFILWYSNNDMLLKKLDDDFEIPQRKDFTEPIQSAQYLFSLNTIKCFGVVDSQTNINPFEFHDIFVLRTLKNKQLAWMASVGYQLIAWYKNNKYCGVCGSKTELKTDERAIVCHCCTHVIYPKISPAVIVAITCNNKILLAKGKHYKGDFYALIAGYVDVGESIEETVIREVKEEVGLDITQLKYYKSQPWPFSSSIMLGFTAQADENQPLVLDENEIGEAGWFARGNLPNHASDISISGNLIRAFENGLF